MGVRECVCSEGFVCGGGSCKFLYFFILGMCSVESVCECVVGFVGVCV